MPHPEFEPRFNPRTSLYEVHDDRGPVEDFEDLATFGDAEGWALQMIADAEAEAAAQADFDAAAATLAYGLGELLAEAA